VNQEELSLEKSRLECEKLAAEIKSIRKPFFHTTAFYTAIAPILLAIAGLIFSWHTGWFDVQRTKINNEETLVRAQTERLQMDKDRLAEQTHRQQSHLTAIENEVSTLRLEKLSLTNQIALLERERGELKLAKTYFEKEVQRFANVETNAAVAFTALQQAQKERRILADQLTDVLRSNSVLKVTAENQGTVLQRVGEYLLEDIRIQLGEKIPDSRYHAHHKEGIELAGTINNMLPKPLPAPSVSAESFKPSPIIPTRTRDNPRPLPPLD
jgi:chromosome segregation ATPase